MSIVVAVPDSVEGEYALRAAVAEAKEFGTDVIAVNLGLTRMRFESDDPSVPVRVVERIGREDRDPVDAVLDEVNSNNASRLVVGVRRRSRVSKAVLGSVSQRLILDSPVPVVAVKPPVDAPRVQ